jgi:hypothetical protein
MAHPEQLAFIDLTRSYLIEDIGSSDVLEIGSCDVSGSIREIFDGARSYRGVDLVEGPGVDYCHVGP